MINIQKGNPLVVVTGPTATGKTAFAAHLAYDLDGEIISADSRQVYRGMDLATGKDKEDFRVEGRIIPSHLVDILDPGYEYNVYEFQEDFLRSYTEINKRGKLAVLCGGTGMYVESVLRGYKLIRVPENELLREEMDEQSNDNLKALLKSFKVPHNVTDTEDRKRLLRAVEIQIYYRDHPENGSEFPDFNSMVLGINFEREEIRKRITARLKDRLDKGMLDEVKVLLEEGLSPDQLKFYGLEYRYLTQYVTGEITYDEMFRLLNTAIHQFAKRQMTWFRKMEKSGVIIHWIDGGLSMKEKVSSALKIIRNEYE